MKSDKSGKPAGSNIHYLSISPDSTRGKIDTFDLIVSNAILAASAEPLLYNYYLGHDRYRFIWHRSLHQPVVISLHKSNDVVWLSVKKLNRRPEIFKKFEFIDINSSSMLFEQPPADCESPTIAPPTIARNFFKILSLDDWTQFQALLDTCHFYSLRNSAAGTRIDGSMWIIEAHAKNRYHMVARHSPKDSFKYPGEFLIALSGLNEDIY